MLWVFHLQQLPLPNKNWKLHENLKAPLLCLAALTRVAWFVFQVRVKVAYVHTGKAQTEANPHFTPSRPQKV
jgi:hypothetical protein